MGYNHFVSVVSLVKAAIAPREELAAGSDLPRRMTDYTGLRTLF